MSKGHFHKFFHDFFSWQHVAIWVVLVILTGVGVAWGYNSEYSGWMAYGHQTITIPADQYYGSSYPCKDIANSNSATYFIPTKTVTEWQAFTGHLPSGVTLSTCSTCTNGYKDSDKDSYGAGPNDCYDPSSSYNIVQNNTDCDDSAANVFPGNTTTDMKCTYSSSCAGFYGDNNDSGDHNCDSTVNKGMWQGPVVAVPYPSSSALPSSLYYINGSGVYTPISTSAGSCGQNFLIGGSSSSWYMYSGGNYTNVFWGEAKIYCK